MQEDFITGNNLGDKSMAFWKGEEFVVKSPVQTSSCMNTPQNKKHVTRIPRSAPIKLSSTPQKHSSSTPVQKSLEKFFQEDTPCNLDDDFISVSPIGVSPMQHTSRCDPFTGKVRGT